jgi:UDP-N-acetylglucosamine acyltransferase
VLAGLNTVGMKRNKMRLSEIEEIKNAYRILFMSKLTLNDALLKLEDNPSQYVQEILKFIKSSQRGIARP